MQYRLNIDISLKYILRKIFEIKTKSENLEKILKNDNKTKSEDLEKISIKQLILKHLEKF